MLGLGYEFNFLKKVEKIKDNLFRELKTSPSREK